MELLGVNTREHSVSSTLHQSCLLTFFDFCPLLWQEHIVLQALLLRYACAVIYLFEERCTSRLMCYDRLHNSWLTLWESEGNYIRLANWWRWLIMHRAKKKNTSATVPFAIEILVIGKRTAVISRLPASSIPNMRTLKRTVAGDVK